MISKILLVVSNKGIKNLMKEGYQYLYLGMEMTYQLNSTEPLIGSQLARRRGLLRLIVQLY